MSGPVGRWLETFMCKQYADIFEAYGFKTLQSVCQLQLRQLHAMGVAQEHCEMILENVNVLRQSMFGQGSSHCSNEAYSNQTGMHGSQNYSNHQMSGMQGYGNQGHYGSSNHQSSYQHNTGSNMFPRHHPVQHQQFMDQQQYNAYHMTQGGQNPYGSQYNQMGSGYGPGPPMCEPSMGHQEMMQQQSLQQQQQQQQQPPNRSHGPTTNVRQTQQNPQDVANSILQMTASYQPNQTVQVPLSKQRPAPYHVPKSPHYMHAQGTSPTQQLQQQQQMQGGQFAYPGSSPSQVPSRTSPISPGSAFMHSPASHHSSHSVMSSSPRSVQSPTGSVVKSPVPPPSPANIRSPIRPNVCSPTPLTQQLHVSVPNHQHSHMVAMSPKPNPVSPASHLSSPYTPMSSRSLQSPQQQRSPKEEYLSEGSQPNIPPSANNPLSSLEKLCRLSENQVVDPKSVVHDACLSPNGESPKNLNSSADSFTSQSVKCEKDNADGFSTGTQTLQAQHFTEASCSEKSSNIKNEPPDTDLTAKQDVIANIHEKVESSVSNSLEISNESDCTLLVKSELTSDELKSCENDVKDPKETNIEDDQRCDDEEKVLMAKSPVEVNEETCSSTKHENITKESNADKDRPTVPDNSGSDSQRENDVCVSTSQELHDDDGIESLRPDETRSADCNTCEKTEDSANSDSEDKDKKSLVDVEKATNGLNHGVLQPRFIPNNLVKKVVDLGCDVKFFYDDVMVSGDKLSLDHTNNNILESLRVENKLHASKLNDLESDCISEITKKELVNMNMSVSVMPVSLLRTNGSTPDDQGDETESTTSVKENHITRGKGASGRKEKCKKNTRKGGNKPPERTRSLRDVPARLASAAFYYVISDDDSDEGSSVTSRKGTKATMTKATRASSQDTSSQDSFLEVVDTPDTSNDTWSEKKKKRLACNAHSVTGEDEHDGIEFKAESTSGQPSTAPKTKRSRKDVLKARDDVDSSDQEVVFNFKQEPEEEDSNQPKKNVKRRHSGPSVPSLQPGCQTMRKRRRTSPMKYRGGEFCGGDYVFDSDEEVKIKKSKVVRSNATSKQHNIEKCMEQDIIVVDSGQSETESHTDTSDVKKDIKIVTCTKVTKVHGNVQKSQPSSSSSSPQKEKICSSSKCNVKTKVKKNVSKTGSSKSGKGKLKKMELHSKDSFGNDSMEEMKLKHTLKHLKTKYNKKAVISEEKSKGPYIHIEGPLDNPTVCSIVNDPVIDKHLDKATKHKKKPTSVAVSTVHLSRVPSEKSVLVPNNTVQDETTWVCALCKKHSSFKFLGDLFGPYYIEGQVPKVKPAPDSTAGQSLHENTSAKKKRNSLGANLQEDNQAKKSKSVQKSATSLNQQEVWVHEDCMAWADGVLLIGQKIYGLEEATKVASVTMCSICKEYGAMVGCLHKGCSQKYHYICAVERGCYLDEGNFSLLCVKHKLLRDPNYTYMDYL